MEDFKSKHALTKSEPFVFSTPFLIVVGLITLSVISGAWGMYEKAKVTQENLQKIKEVYAESQTREQRLAAHVEQLQTPFGIETEIRNKYGFVKKGEEVVVVVDELNKDDNASTTVGSHKSLWRKIADLF